MDYFVFDWESFYDSKAGYTLKKITLEEYINDPRFHAFGFSVSKNGGSPLWVPEGKIEFMLRQLKLHEHAVIAHNAPFDMAILNWKYGIKPKFVIDTLAMARGVLGNEERLSLAMLGERFNIGTKGEAILHMDGVRNPSPQMARKLGEYCNNDVDMTWKLWLKLKENFPVSELVVIDLTTRMYSEPSFALDKTPILRELELGEERKKKLLEQANCTMEDLRSDEKFAALLQSLGVDPPRKVSAKKSKKAGHTVYAWAFAKSDVDFKALGDHEEELVRWAVEARLGLKSTIKQSRAERFLGVAERMGVMPVALAYYGAGTGRYAAESSAKMNMQNLPAVRGSKDPDVGLLRKSLVAPSGKVVVVSDASQIEARLLAWQAGQDNVVEAFAQGRDVYSEMASVIFSRHVDRKANPDDYIPGFIGKATVLGCLGPDTQVLTDSGWKSIVCVKATDKLWDGEEWVCHKGKVQKGVKEVVRAFGLTATTDHEILTEHGWREWKEVHTNHSLFQSAMSKASLPSSTGSGLSASQERQKGGIQWSSAHVDTQGKLIDKTLQKESQLGVMYALKKRATILVKSIGVMPPFFRMTRTVNDYLTGFRVAYRGVIRHTARCLNTTAGVVLQYFLRGAPEWQDGARFLATSSPSLVGTYLTSRLTASTSTGDMNRAIFASLLSQRMPKINGKSLPCNSRSMTYDIAFSGPRNRFTVATSAGPVIVHNCGYGLGHMKFASMIYSGMLGMKGIFFDDAMAAQLGVNVNEYAKFIMKDQENIDRLQKSKPAGLDGAQWVRHCACAKKIIDKFRGSNRAIVEYWKRGEDMLYAMLKGTEEKIGLFQTKKNGLMLPNGMWLHFKELEKNSDGFSCLRKKEGRVQRVKVYGGFLVENVTQALSGCCTKEAMVHMRQKGYRTILQVHDEVVVLADEADAENALRVVNSCMETVPAWAVGLPLASEGSWARSYGEAK